MYYLFNQYLNFWTWNKHEEIKDTSLEVRKGSNDFERIFQKIPNEKYKPLNRS